MTQSKEAKQNHEIMQKEMFSAVMEGNAEKVRELIAAGYDINQKQIPANEWFIGQKGYPLLNIAITKKHYDIARILIEANANVNAQDDREGLPH